LVTGRSHLPSVGSALNLAENGGLKRLISL